MKTKIGRADQIRIGVLGGGYFGTQWGEPERLIPIETPYGSPSDSICEFRISDRHVFTLQRHGAEHQFGPQDVPWRANAMAFRILDVGMVFHVTVCGTLTDEYAVGDVVLLDQILDFTRNRPTTMGPPAIEKVTHLQAREPFCRETTHRASVVLDSDNVSHKTGGVMATIEGPRFSTRAESDMYRMLGGTLVNMSSSPEVFLLRELGLTVVGFALVTDGDNLARDNADLVSDAVIVKNLSQNLDVIPNALASAAAGIAPPSRSRVSSSPFDSSRLNLRPKAGPNDGRN